MYTRENGLDRRTNGCFGEEEDREGLWVIMEEIKGVVYTVQLLEE